MPQNPDRSLCIDVRDAIKNIFLNDSYIQTLIVKPDSTYTISTRSLILKTQKFTKDHKYIICVSMYDVNFNDTTEYNSGGYRGVVPDIMVEVGKQGADKEDIEGEVMKVLMDLDYTLFQNPSLTYENKQHANNITISKHEISKVTQVGSLWSVVGSFKVIPRFTV